MRSERDDLRNALVSFSDNESHSEIAEPLIELCRSPSKARLLGYWRTYVHLHEPGTFSDSSGKLLGRGYILWEQKGGVTFTWQLSDLRTGISDLMDRGDMDDFLVIEESNLVPTTWTAELEHLPEGWIEANHETFDGQGSIGYLDNGDEIYPVVGFESDERGHQTVAAWGSRSGRITMVTLQVEGYPDLKLYPMKDEDKAAITGLKTLLLALSP